jgi:hypothetical protein
MEHAVLGHQRGLRQRERLAGPDAFERDDRVLQTALRVRQKLL